MIDLLHRKSFFNSFNFKKDVNYNIKLIIFIIFFTSTINIVDF